MIFNRPKEVRGRTFSRLLLIALYGAVMIFPAPPAFGEGSGGPRAAEAPPAERDALLPPWVPRSCCEMPASLATADGGSNMAETVALLCVENALRTVDEAVAVQRKILEGSGGHGDTAGSAFEQVEVDLRRAGWDLAGRKRLLARGAAGKRPDLFKSLRDAERLVKMDLLVQRRLLRGDGSRNATLLRRLDSISRHLDRSLADHRRIVAGRDGVGR